MHFVNADVIARGLNASEQLTVAVDAGRLMLQEVRENIQARASFAFETTLSGRSWAMLLKQAKAAGFEIAIHYVLVRSEDLAVKRVAQRVCEGGHLVLESDIRRRFHRSKQMFLSTYRLLADRWYLFDNSNSEARCLATDEFGKFTVFDEQAFEAIWLPEKFPRK